MPTKMSVSESILEAERWLSCLGDESSHTSLTASDLVRLEVAVRTLVHVARVVFE